MQKQPAILSLFCFALLSSSVSGAASVEEYFAKNGECLIFQDPSAEFITEAPFGKPLYEWTEQDVAAFKRRGLHCLRLEMGDDPVNLEAYTWQFNERYEDLQAEVDAAKRERGSAVAETERREEQQQLEAELEAKAARQLKHMQDFISTYQDDKPADALRTAEALMRSSQGFSLTASGHAIWEAESTILGIQSALEAAIAAEAASAPEIAIQPGVQNSPGESGEAGSAPQGSVPQAGGQSMMGAMEEVQQFMNSTNGPVYLVNLLAGSRGAAYSDVREYLLDLAVFEPVIQPTDSSCGNAVCQHFPELQDCDETGLCRFSWRLNNYGAESTHFEIVTTGGDNPVLSDIVL